MTRAQLAIIVGGLVPAVCLGLSGVSQKFSAVAGLGAGGFLVITGITTVAVGLTFSLLERDWSWAPSGMGYAVLFGLFWATGTGCIAIALKRYGAQISQLVPLYNMNTLIAVLVGLIAFAEWRTVHPVKLLIAAALIISGGIVASKA